jgi:uncharacterized protein
MIWVLWHQRQGDLNQMKVLAEALRLPFEIKRLEFYKPHYAPLAQVLLRNGEILNGPYPQIILCAEAMCSTIAHDLKKRCSAKTIALARPCGDPQKFDLVLTTAQYGLMGDSIVTLDLPFTLPPQFQEKRRSDGPIVVLIGGSAPPDILDKPTAEKMCRDLRTNRNIQFITSPRTPLEIAKVFAKHFPQIHFWNKDQQNPYKQALASASEIIVTSDSVSMLADALAQDVPVHVYQLAQRLNAAQSWLNDLYKRNPKHFIFAHGLIEATPDRSRLVSHLLHKGYVQWFGHAQITRKSFDPDADLQTALKAVRNLTRLNLPH